jgi:hypothetical protein
LPSGSAHVDLNFVTISVHVVIPEHVVSLVFFAVLGHIISMPLPLDPIPDPVKHALKAASRSWHEGGGKSCVVEHVKLDLFCAQQSMSAFTSSSQEGGALKPSTHSVEHFGHVLHSIALR